jgi:phospholipase C
MDMSRRQLATSCPKRATRLLAGRLTPSVWSRPASVGRCISNRNLDYDENDGIFDHVPPPVPPPGTPGEFVDGMPIGGGFRVPCIIVSPWTAGGWVCSQPFDHTSVLRFLEKLTGVKETNISEWRRATFGDLTSAFRFEQPKADPPALPDTSGPLAAAFDQTIQLPKPTIPTSDQNVPVQETGNRKKVPT